MVQERYGRYYDSGKKREFQVGSDLPRNEMMPVALQEVRVSNGKELAEILRSLGRIEAKLCDIKETQTEHGTRIAWLESKANWAIGGLAVFTFLISSGFEFVKGLFR